LPKFDFVLGGSSSGQHSVAELKADFVSTLRPAGLDFLRRRRLAKNIDNAAYQRYIQNISQFRGGIVNACAPVHPHAPREWLIAKRMN
jgi:hypothetical protein